MTDFLTSLMARSFGTETAIRPRVASLFEPVRNGDTALREQHAAEPMETAIAREVEVESQGEHTVSTPTPSTLREDIQGRDAKHIADANAAAAVLPPREDSERRRTAVLADKTREKEDTVFAAKMRPRGEVDSHEANSVESEPELRSDSEAGKSRRASARALAVSPARDEFVEKDHRELVLRPKVATELTAQMKTAALAMNAGLSAPARERARMALPALAAEPEPSVHVTIGRIEVRATSEIKQTGRPRPASPVMSLKEYLHRCTQRGGQ
jgi:hypothetical protein